VGAEQALQKTVPLNDYAKDAFITTGVDFQFFSGGFTVSLGVGNETNIEKWETISAEGILSGEGVVQFGVDRIGIVPTDSKQSPRITKYQTSVPQAIITDLALLYPVASPFAEPVLAANTQTATVPQAANTEAANTDTTIAEAAPAKQKTFF
jgi:hypothetical protein